MLTVAEFYAEEHWGWPFGATGSDYTIVPGRHIGLDLEQTGDVPALLSGTVTVVLLTSAMAWCVEVLSTDGTRLTYCHLANDDLPQVGQVLAQGDRVGRLATGPRTLPLRDPDFPGTAWYGMHLHLVCSRIARAAWTIVAGRTLADFTDPTIIIRSVLSGTAADTARPFEEDDMYDTNAEKALFAKIEAETRPFKTYQLGSGLILIGDGGAVYTIPSQAYQDLLIAQGLTSATVQRVLDPNELAFIQGLRGKLSPDPRDVQVQAILQLTEEDAKRIAANLPAPVLTVTNAQLEAMGSAIVAKLGSLSADVAAKASDAVKEALDGLSFVVKTS